jgi:hypothetical protein
MNNKRKKKEMKLRINWPAKQQKTKKKKGTRPFSSH